MKPTNKNKPLLLNDNAPVSCCFHYGMEPCEQDSTVKLEISEIVRFQKFLSQHPQSMMYLGKKGLGHVYLCDVHAEIVQSSVPFDD